MRPDDYIPPRAIPLSERLPKPHDLSSTSPQDCDPMGRCWFGTPASEVMEANWVYRKIEHRRSWDTHWLPYWALSLPTAP